MSDALPPWVERVDTWRCAPGETQRLEFKEARNQFEYSRLREYCVALANEGGGHLLLGITDTPPRSVVGTQAFRDPISTAERLYDALGFRVEVHEVNHPQGRVVVFEIPSRPHGTAYHLDGRYLMRSGSALVPMSEDRLRKVFAEGKKHWLDERFASGLSAEEAVSRLDIGRYFELLKLPQPYSMSPILKRLEGDRIILRDGATYSITNLGQILFARNLARFEDIGRKAARVISYEGTGKISTLRDHIVTRGYAASFEHIIELVELQTPVREVIERALRREERAYPSVAVRELIANALIHQDLHTYGASVMIELYADRIEISNPGQPDIQFDRFIDGYQCRNEPMADLMRRFAICEGKGSGIDKVIRAVEENHLPPLEYRVDSVRTSCILRGPRPFSAMSRGDRIRACYQHCCLRYVSGEPMTNQSLRERFQLTDAQNVLASQVIATASAAGQIKLDPVVAGSRRFARYLPFWA